MKDLRSCLFQAFANEYYVDPQELRYLWAIREAVGRVDPYNRKWKETRARKEHECVRGHMIESRQFYYRYPTGPGWGQGLKFCVSCVAMIFYYRDDIYELEPWAYTHWDTEKEEPVRHDEPVS